MWLFVLIGIDGCGLALESDVRLSYYTLLRYLIKAVRSIKRPALMKYKLNIGK